MPKASKATASENIEVEGYEGHLEHLDGGYTVAFEAYTADADLGRLSRACPTTSARRRTGATCSRAGSSTAMATTRRSSRPLTPTTCRPATRRPVRGHDAGRVQPHRRAPPDDRGRHQEHGGRRRVKSHAGDDRRDLDLHLELGERGAEVAAHAAAERDPCGRAARDARPLRVGAEREHRGLGRWITARARAGLKRWRRPTTAMPGATRRSSPRARSRQRG